MRSVHGGNSEPSIVQPQHWVHLSLNATKQMRDGTATSDRATSSAPDETAQESENDMAYATDIRTANTTLISDRFHAVVAAFQKARRQNRVYRQTMTELNGLTGRELDDLGISAREIPAIAREAAQMVD